MAKKLLLTGGGGFLGSTIYKTLYPKYEIIKAGISPDSDFFFNLTHGPIELPFCDYVVHCAGKAHTIVKNKKEEREIYEVNFGGTVNLCRSFDKSSFKPVSFVYISTVSVYGLKEGELIDENTELLALDPYGRSKIKAEEFLKEWCGANSINLLILRPALVIGEKAKGNYKSIIKAIKAGIYFGIGRGTNRKSMVLDTDIAECIKNNLGSTGIYNLTDGIHPRIVEFENALSQKYKGRNLRRYNIVPLLFVLKRLPYIRAYILKIMSNLTFDSRKAEMELNFRPGSVLDFIRNA